MHVCTLPCKVMRVKIVTKQCNFMLLCPAPKVGGIKWWCASDVCLTSDVCLSRTSGLRREQKTDRPRKTKIGTEVADVTRDSDTIIKVKRSKVNLQGGGILWRPPAQLVVSKNNFFVCSTHIICLHCYQERSKCWPLALTHCQMVMPLLYCTCMMVWSAVTLSINSREYCVCHIGNDSLTE